MTQRKHPVFGYAVIAVVLATTGGLSFRQYIEATRLRLLCAGRADLEAELRAAKSENAALRAKQISKDELNALRADSTAVDRLRAELAQLKAEAARPAPQS